MAKRARARRKRHFEKHRNAFAEGQLVAIADGEVVGAASALAVQWDDYALDHTWKRVTGDGSSPPTTPPVVRN